MTLLGGNESTIRPESLSDFLPVIRRQRRAVLDLGAINRDSLPEYLIKELRQPYARLHQLFVDHRESAHRIVIGYLMVLWESRLGDNLSVLSTTFYPPLAPARIIPKLDWFQALGIKRYTSRRGLDGAR